MTSTRMTRAAPVSSDDDDASLHMTSRLPERKLLPADAGEDASPRGYTDHSRSRHGDDAGDQDYKVSAPLR